MIAPLQRVITIHGIWTEGRWQETIAPILWPHFKPVSIKYPHYHLLGPLDLVLEPAILFPGILVLILAARREWLVGRWLWVAAAFLVIVAHWATRFRQQKALDALLREADPAIFPTAAIHVIAHSFGTYLFAKAIKNDDSMRVNRLVLTGCILNGPFGWKTILEDKNAAFQAIRNDAGRKDFPVWLAGHLHWLLPDFGEAGRSGFDLDPGWVHDISSLQDVCRICQYSPIAPIHNVFNDLGYHDTPFKNLHYVAWHWLPFFWGIEPIEYRDFIELCWGIGLVYREAPKLRVRGIDPAKYRLEFLENLLSRRWSWAGGHSAKLH